MKPFKGRSPRLSRQSMWRSVPYIPSQTARTLKNLDQTFLYNPPILGNQRTGGLAWIWRQPPKLQAGGSNPLPFAILSNPVFAYSSPIVDSLFKGVEYRWIRFPYFPWIRILKPNLSNIHEICGFPHGNRCFVRFECLVGWWYSASFRMPVFQFLTPPQHRCRC